MDLNDPGLRNLLPLISKFLRAADKLNLSSVCKTQRKLVNVRELVILAKYEFKRKFIDWDYRGAIGYGEIQLQFQCGLFYEIPSDSKGEITIRMSNYCISPTHDGSENLIKHYLLAEHPVSVTTLATFDRRYYERRIPTPSTCFTILVVIELKGRRFRISRVDGKKITRKMIISNAVFVYKATFLSNYLASRK